MAGATSAEASNACRVRRRREAPSGGADVLAEQFSWTRISIIPCVLRFRLMMTVQSVHAEDTVVVRLAYRFACFGNLLDKLSLAHDPSHTAVLYAIALQAAGFLLALET